MSFTEKVVIVTGASSGIGAATAILFAREGANVVAVGRNETKLKEVTKQISKVGKAPLVIRADVAVDKETERIINETVAEYGKIDILVNNAGIISFGTILEGNIVEAYDTAMSVNMRSVVKLTTLATPHLIKTKGNIVNVSSAAALTVHLSTNMFAYSVSKAALDHFTKASAAELGPSGIRVNSVNPGAVATDIFTNSGLDSWSWEESNQYMALNKIATPEEIADLISFIASDKAQGMTGSIVVLDNGYLIKSG